MLNYLKSELYRLKYNLWLFLLIGGVSVGGICMNLLLRVTADADRAAGGLGRYGNIGFLVRIALTFVPAAIFLVSSMTLLLFGDEFKNRTMGNVIAFGISQTKMILGKFLIAVTVGILGMLFIEGVTLGSAYLLLEHTGFADFATAQDAMMAVVQADIVAIPLFVAAVAALLAAIAVAKTEMSGLWLWIGGVYGLAQIMSILGLKFKVCSMISDWMIYNVLNSAFQINAETGESIFVWNQTPQVVHALVVGAVSTILFLGVAIVGSKREK